MTTHPVCRNDAGLAAAELALHVERAVLQTGEDMRPLRLLLESQLHDAVACGRYAQNMHSIRDSSQLSSSSSGSFWAWPPCALPPFALSQLQPRTPADQRQASGLVLKGVLVQEPLTPWARLAC